jgi:CcmD family protein
MRAINLSFLLICFTICFLSPIFGFAQEVEMADAMRSNGKIYVVVSVVFVILLGILFYIFRTDSKLTKLEEEIDSLKKSE